MFLKATGPEEALCSLLTVRPSPTFDRADQGATAPTARPLIANQTGPLDFGHFCAEVPKSLHVAA
jgi:hypothetical protein